MYFLATGGMVRETCSHPPSCLCQLCHHLSLQVGYMPSVVGLRLIGASEEKPGPYIRFDEMRALRRLQREQEPRSPFVFTSERGSPFTTAGFARMLERAGEAAGLALKVHPHMLRHACGFALANKGHDTRALHRRAPRWKSQKRTGDALAEAGDGGDKNGKALVIEARA